MEKELQMDARKKPNALFDIRKQIIRLHKKGLGPMAIKDVVGVSWNTVRKAIDLYKGGGIKALIPKCRGCKKGEIEPLRRNRKHKFRRLFAINDPNN